MTGAPVTAHAIKEEEQAIRDSGVTEILTKPIDENLLFEKLEAYLG